LPTSLTYIILKARGYSPWRPAAVISTATGETTELAFHGSSRALQTIAQGKALPFTYHPSPDNLFPGTRKKLKRRDGSS